MQSGELGDEEGRGDDGEMRCVHQQTAELSMRGAEKRLGQLESFKRWTVCLTQTQIHIHMKKHRSRSTAG